MMMVMTIQFSSVLVYLLGKSAANNNNNNNERVLGTLNGVFVSQVIYVIHPTGFSMEPLSKLRRSLSSYSGHHSREERVHVPMPQEQFAPEMTVHWSAKHYAPTPWCQCRNFLRPFIARLEVCCCVDPFILTRNLGT
jgi:hypothetical protein